MPRQPIRVHIFNQTYTLLTDGDEAEVQTIAHEIDELMTSIANRASSGDSTRVAVLACLHLADKLKNAEKKLQEFEDQSGRLSDLLNSALLD
jgi:cell division protein ZapA